MLRAFAVVMMIQGHTIHTFLSSEFRTSEYFFYTAWHWMRGFTAPIFMFTAGVVFTYLLHNKNLPVGENPRIKKGLKRFITLVVIGYLLRFPTLDIFHFDRVTQEQWLIFFSVDALHLIGFGILAIVVLTIAAEKFHISNTKVYLLGALFFVLLTPIIREIIWSKILPLPLAAYFDRSTGSIFPFFPWLAYLLGGSVLGNYLAHRKGVQRTQKFGITILIIGIILFSASFLLDSLQYYAMVDYSNWLLHYSVFLNRIGFVLMLASGLAFFASKLKSLPEVVKILGRHTLVIYVIHLIILYGSVLSIGFYQRVGETLNTFQSILAAIIMIAVMTIMAFGLEKLKPYFNNFIKVIHNKYKFLAAKFTL